MFNIEQINNNKQFRKKKKKMVNNNNKIHRIRVWQSIYTSSRYNDDVNERIHIETLSETIVYRNKISGAKWAYGNLKHNGLYMDQHHHAPNQKNWKYIEIWNDKNFSIFNFISENLLFPGHPEHFILVFIERQFLFFLLLLFIYFFVRKAKNPLYSIQWLIGNQWDWNRISVPDWPLL